MVLASEREAAFRVDEMLERPNDDSSVCKTGLLVEEKLKLERVKFDGNECKTGLLVDEKLEFEKVKVNGSECKVGVRVGELLNGKGAKEGAYVDVGNGNGEAVV